MDIVNSILEVKKRFRLTYPEIAKIIGYKRISYGNIVTWIKHGEVPVIWIARIKEKLLTMTEERAEKIYIARCAERLKHRKERMASDNNKTS